MNARLYIAAKRPSPHVSKTRLGARIGHERAALVYRGFLRDLASRFEDFSHPVGWFVPPGSWPAIRAVVGSSWDSRPLVLQRGRDWGERQRRLFNQAGPRGEEATVLIASDSPQLPRHVVEEAFALLEESDLVLGPVEDGGYYLLGIRGAHDVLKGVRMSTTRVSEEIRARCSRLALKVAVLEPMLDVDEAEDLERLLPLIAAQPDLTATRAALA